MTAHEQRAKIARKAVPAAGMLSVVLMLIGAAADGSAMYAAPRAGWVLLVLIGVFSLLNATLGWKLFDPYPALGARKKLWVQAGATPGQLSALNEIHRLQRLNPPVGYGDRRTLATPLADAYAIFSSPAWRDPWLADRRLLIDPIAEAGEIVAYINKVTRMLLEVRAKRDAALRGSATRAQYDSYEHALLQSLNEALMRASALSRYRMELHRLEVLLVDQRALPEAEAMADRVMDVLSESARHRMGAQYLQDCRVQLAMVESGLREITAILTNTTLDARAPYPR